MPADLVRTLVKSTATAADVLRPPARGLVVLIYHRVGRRTSTEVDLPLGAFEDQIAWLAATLPVVTLDTGLAGLSGAPASAPDRSAPDRSAAPGASAPDGGLHAPPGLQVAITFDDGTADFAELAVPVLERYRVPATLYLATAFVEEGRPFPHDGVPLGWSALTDCLATGLVEVGSHTHGHALLDRLPEPAIGPELDRSIELIGERLGVRARHFAYPKAVMGSPAADRAVRARFVSAALAGGHANRPGRTDPYRLARTPVQHSDGETWFRRKARGGLALEESLRGLLNRRRYSDATT